MKSRFVQYSAVSVLLAATALTPATALAEYKCHNPTVRIDQRACAKAAEGMNALSQFVWRTRTIWNLDMADYVAPEDQHVAKIVLASPAPRESQASAKPENATEAR